MWWDIAALALCHAAQYYSLVCIYSYVGFLAVDLGWIADKDDAGFVSGLLGAAMPLARLFTAVPWGRAADRFGRRPVVLLSMTSLTVGHLCFAFARPLWLAICTRLVLMGGLNGWPTLTGLLAREVGGTEREHAALGQIYAAAGLMMLVAPGVGAGLYGVDVFGDRFPAAGPSLVGAFLSASAALMVAVFIPETKPQTKPESATESVSEQLPQTVNLLATLRKRPFPALLCLRSALGVVEMATNDVVPLFLIASTQNGGLDLSVKRLGVVMMLSAATSSLYISLLSASVTKHVGNDKTIIYGALVQALMLACLLVFPSLPLQWPFQMIAAIPLAIFQIAFTHVFGGLVAAYNAAVAQHPGQAGVLNGVGASCMAAAMAVGPLIAAPPFAAAIHALPPQSNLPKLLGVLLDGASIVWAVLGLLLFAIAMIGCLFSSQIRLSSALEQAQEAETHVEQLLPKVDVVGPDSPPRKVHNDQP